MIDMVGRLHPLIVHLPLGIWILLGIIMVLPQARRSAMEAAIGLGIRIATLSAVSAAITGYLLSLSGEYDPDTVNIHQWLGIGTAAAGLAAWLLPAWRRILTLSTCAIMAVAGHYGGVLTHGEGYLFGSSDSDNIKARTVTDTLNSVDTMTTSVQDSTTPAVTFRHPFRDDIKPILASKCENCHSAKKRKGRLRLDTEAFIRQGGKNGSILTPGKPDASPLFTHLVLPLEDEMHMPPKGKPQPSTRDIRILRDWIAAGAPFGPVQVSDTKTIPQVTIPDIPVAVSGPSAPEMSEPSDQPSVSETIPAEDPALKEYINVLNTLGPSATMEGNGIALNFINMKDISPELMKAMETHRDRIVALNLRDMKGTDALLESLPKMPALRSINLARTDITDMGTRKLEKFGAIEKIVLYETEISDKTLASFKDLNQLKNLNTWRTRVTDSGVQSLQRVRPGLKIETGRNTLRKPDSTQRIKP